MKWLLAILNLFGALAAAARAWAMLLGAGMAQGFVSTPAYKAMLGARVVGAVVALTAAVSSPLRPRIGAALTLLGVALRWGCMYWILVVELISNWDKILPGNLIAVPFYLIPPTVSLIAAGVAILILRHKPDDIAPPSLS
jgi:hypothetical protein